MSIVTATCTPFLPPHTQFQFNILTNQRLNSVMRCHEVESLFEYDLPEVLKVRVPGTPEHEVVKNVRLAPSPHLSWSHISLTLATAVLAE